YTVPVATFWSGLGTGNPMRTMQFQFTVNTTSVVYFDNIQLLTPQVNVLDPVIGGLAGPPAVGQPGYSGPAICCYANTTFTPPPTAPTAAGTSGASSARTAALSPFVS